MYGGFSIKNYVSMCLISTHYKSYRVKKYLTVRMFDRNRSNRHQKIGSKWNSVGNQIFFNNIEA